MIFRLVNQIEHESVLEQTAATKRYAYFSPNWETVTVSAARRWGSLLCVQEEHGVRWPIRESSELLEAWKGTELKFQCVRCNLLISVRKIQACGKWDLCFECPSQMDADTSMEPFFNGERIGNHRNGTPREMAEVQMIYHGGKASML